MRVTLQPSIIAYFKNLEVIDPATGQSTHPDEYSGLLQVKSDGSVRLADVHSYARTRSQVPLGAVNFHTHNVPPGSKFAPNLSSDVPSWQDMNLIVVDTLHHGLKDHLVFTPNYSYVISLSPGLRRQFADQSRIGANNLNAHIYSKTKAVYNKLVNKHGENFGRAFVLDWLTELRREGFVIQQRREGDPISFEVTGALETPLETLPGGPSMLTPRNIAIAAGVLILLIALGVWLSRRRGEFF